MISCDWCKEEIVSIDDTIHISPDEYPKNMVNNVVFHRHCFEEWFPWISKATKARFKREDKEDIL